MQSKADLHIYSGEKASRSRAVAIALNTVFPGVGHVYVGLPVQGLLRALTLFTGILLFISAWRIFKFVPHLPLAVLLISAGIFILNGAIDAGNKAKELQNEYYLRPFNRPMVYAVMILCWYLIPWSTLVWATSTQMVKLSVMEDAGMYPMIFPGDRLLVDQMAYRRFPPRHGDLVAIQYGRSSLQEGTAITVRRVIAGPGDQIYILEDGQIIINGQRLPREFKGRLNIPGDGDPLGAVSYHLIGYQEKLHTTSYTITHRPMGVRSLVGPIVIEKEHLYLVGDNRDNSIDSRHFGMISQQRIMGRPLMVLWSREPTDGKSRPKRAGLRLDEHLYKNR